MQGGRATGGRTATLRKTNGKMNTTVIDTLRFADRLKAAGFEAPHAEGLARALGGELAERIVTKNDLDEALRPIYARFDAIDARFDAMAGNSDARFDAIDARFDAMAGNSDARFDAIDARIDAMARSTGAKFDAIDARIDAMARSTDARFDAIDARVDAMARSTDARFDAMAESSDARFDALDEKIDSVHRELSGKFNILVGVMALGFTLLTGLGGYNAMYPHYAKSVRAVPEVQEQAAETRGAATSPPLTGD